MSAYLEFQKYVTDVEASSTYKSWCNAHGADCSAWQTYRTGVLATSPPPAAPALSTRFGQSLVDVAIMAIDAGLTPPPPPPPPPTITAAFAFTTSGLTANFTNESTPGPSGTITNYLWDFGDGNTSTAASPAPHTYASGGTRTVTLTVTGGGSDGTATTNHPVTVSGGVTTSYQPYIPASAINKKIPPGTPVHPDSALMISTANYWLGTGTWLGPRARPTYHRGDTSNLPHVEMYANSNGWVGAGPFAMPMPSWAAAAIGPTSQRGDSDVVIVDSLTGDVWELWHCTPPGYTPRNSGFPSSRWNCGAYRHWTADTLTQKGYGPPSPNYVPGTTSALIHIACGLIVPEDAADCFSGSDPGTVIPHVLRVGDFCASNGDVHPKSVLPAYGNGDGQQHNGIPMGARIQLDPAIDVTTWPSIVALNEPHRSWMKKMTRTMQQYGLVQTDSFGAPGGGNLDCASPVSVAEGGSTYPVGFKFPNEVAGYGWGLANGVPADLMSHFRVLDWSVTSTWA